MAYYRPRPKRRTPERLPVPLPQQLLDEFDAREYLGASTGHVLNGIAPAPTPLQRPLPPPVDWEAETREAAEREFGKEHLSENAGASAVETVMGNAAKRGEIEPAPLGPVDRSFVPLVHGGSFPEPDWQAEEQAALERNKRARLEQAARLLEENA